MIKKILSAGVLVSMVTAPVAAQVKGQSSDQVFGSQAGKGEIFMDKRSPEEREACGNGFAESGGDSKIFRDKRSPEDRIKCPGGVIKTGGGNDI